MIHCVYDVSISNISIQGDSFIEKNNHYFKIN